MDTGELKNGHNGGPPLEDEPAALGEDLLRGVRAIAEFIGESKTRTYYMCERNYLPVGREGATLVASKRALRAHYDKITGAGAAA